MDDFTLSRMLLENMSKNNNDSENSEEILLGYCNATRNKISLTNEKIQKFYKILNNLQIKELIPLMLDLDYFLDQEINKYIEKQKIKIKKLEIDLEESESPSMERNINKYNRKMRTTMRNGRFFKFNNIEANNLILKHENEISKFLEKYEDNEEKTMITKLYDVAKYITIKGYENKSYILPVIYTILNKFSNNTLDYNEFNKITDI